MVAIGIDLGTTYSCVGVYQHGKVEIIANAEGDRTTPSYVGFTADGKRSVGSAAKNMAARNLKGTVYDAKRLVGRTFTCQSVQDDLKHLSYEVVSSEPGKETGQPRIVVDYNGRKEFRPEEISYMVLEYMKETAEKYIGEKVTDAVITVPAYFNDSQRQATKDAGVMAGLNVLRIINEPTAAALAYGLDKKIVGDETNILVFDLGGGTFDVSILNLAEGGLFTVKATGGDTHLGGEDFDNLVTDFLANEFNRKNKGMDIRSSPKSIKRLKVAAERAKRTLSTSTSAQIETDALYEGVDFNFTLTRAKFENICAKEFQKVLAPVEQVLRDAKLDKGKVSEVVLVGGSTRIPKIQSMLKTFFNGKELNHNVHPDEAVAHGAAIQAANLSGDTSMDLLLVDVAPLSLGVDTEGGRFDPLIPRQTTIPTEQKKTYSTARDGQTGVTIKIYEGERPMTRDNNLLGEFDLSGIPPMKRGQPQIEVTFKLDSNGILNVSAMETSTKSERNIQIQNQKGRLTDEEIAQKVKEAEEYREQDQQNLARFEARQNLENYLYSLESSKDEVEGMTEEDKTTLTELCAEGHKWLDENLESTTEETQAKLKEYLDRSGPIIQKSQPQVNPSQGETPETDQQSTETNVPTSGVVDDLD